MAEFVSFYALFELIVSNLSASFELPISSSFFASSTLTGSLLLFSSSKKVLFVEMLA